VLGGEHLLYLGHFSFDPRRGGEDAIEWGWFTCLVEAESPESAGEKFADLIISLGSSDTLEYVGNVYLEDIIEVKKLPEKGVLVRYEAHTGERAGTISTTLPGVPQEFCVAYEWGPERTEQEEEDGYTPEPFVYHEE
jgi:hypothetical protein